MTEDRIAAGLERLQARREAEAAEEETSIFGHWPPYVRNAIVGWPRVPAISAALRKIQRDSSECYGPAWPLVVAELSDLEVANLLKAWLQKHGVRRAIARTTAKLSNASSRDVMQELQDLRDQAEDRIMEHEERLALREGRDEGEDEGEVRGRAVRGDGEQPPGEVPDASGEAGQRVAAGAAEGRRHDSEAVSTAT